MRRDRIYSQTCFGMHCPKLLNQQQRLIVAKHQVPKQSLCQRGDEGRVCWFFMKGKGLHLGSGLPCGERLLQAASLSSRRKVKAMATSTLTHKMPNWALSSLVLSTLVMASQPAGFIPACLIGVPASGDTPAWSPAAGLGSQPHSLELATDMSQRSNLTSGHLKGCGQLVYCCHCSPHHRFS